MTLHLFAKVVKVIHAYEFVHFLIVVKGNALNCVVLYLGYLFDDLVLVDAVGELLPANQVYASTLDYKVQFAVFVC